MLRPGWKRPPTGFPAAMIVVRTGREKIMPALATDRASCSITSSSALCSDAPLSISSMHVTPPSPCTTAPASKVVALDESRLSDTVSPHELELFADTYTPRGLSAHAARSSCDLPRPGSPKTATWMLERVWLRGVPPTRLSTMAAFVIAWPTMPGQKEPASVSNHPGDAAAARKRSMSASAKTGIAREPRCNTSPRSACFAACTPAALTTSWCAAWAFLGCLPSATLVASTPTTWTTSPAAHVSIRSSHSSTSIMRAMPLPPPAAARSSWSAGASCSFTVCRS
mmetsp:Transcript_4329/g.13852  ORF Transcript_4329/g.13852 Transcript_4329/m.13852 type:complete len:283 (+) Transcript_4329:816-1664(+)